MVLPKAATFLLHPSTPQHQSDPEKGHEPEVTGGQNDHDSTGDEPLHTGRTLVQDDNIQGYENPDEDHLDIDEEQDDNAIIREVEREEYPGEEPTRPPGWLHTSFRSFSTLITGTMPSRLSQSCSKLKAFVNTKTSLEDLESYVPQYRYLPILSGIIIPFSILLEIPGLTNDWYVRTVDNKVVESRPNTVLLDVGLAFSLACGIIANICLFLRFSEKKIKLMTMLCVFFLTIHDLINISVVSIFSVRHRFADGFTYSQAFWMIVCSTSVSSFVNVTLIVDLVRTRDFSHSGSGLTRKQRSLVLSVMVLLCYIAFGAVVQLFLIDGLTFLDALYFTVITIETIGFGDIVPISTGGRIFTCLFSIFGFISLAVTVTLTRETVLEALEVGYRKRVRAVRSRRKQAHRKKKIAERWRAAIEWRLRETGLPIWVMDDPEMHKHTRCMKVLYDFWPWSTGHPQDAHSFNFSGRMHPHGMHLNLEALSRAQLETAALETGVPLCRLLPPGFKMPEPTHQDDMHMQRIEAIKAARGLNSSMPQFAPTQPLGLPMTHARIGRMAVMLESVAFAVTERSFARVAQAAELPPKETDDDQSSVNAPYSWTIAEQYESVRVGMEIEEKRAFAARLFVVWAFFIAFWMVGSGIFTATEGWPFGIAVYFCFIAFTTIGYGDYSPKTPAGRAVFIFWALLGVGTVTILISILSEAYSRRYERSLHSNIFSQAIKRYRENSRVMSEQSRVKRTQSTPHVHESLPEALSDTQKQVTVQLEALPHQVIRQVRTFNENVKYLLEAEVLGEEKETLPDGLKRLLDDVAGAETIGDRIKQEILRDHNTKRALLSISIEDTLRQMIDLAEDALKSLQRRDRINARLSQRPDDIQQPHTPHSDSHETDETAL
ncbi:voltage-gated potassium channel [Tricholoma matsutake]|nr:voltage-gated potassium channel [Tricholoma matsutake 945]